MGAPVATVDYARLPVKEIERHARSVHPGAWAVETQKPLSTLLGSCVAVCLFDPMLRIGGLNHFMLPDMGRARNGDVDSLLSGNFAMEALLNALINKGAKKVRLQAKAFGGGTIIDTDGGSLSIGMRNAGFAKEWLEREGIPLVASDFLGPWSRKVLFLPSSGEAFCKRMVTNMATADVIAREERAYAETLRQPSPTGKKIELF
ncbi:chemotaxis protein CheD [Propionivibrio limicola]|uniref:chemotaxis protein CheD n=1 Tax=Propionivibrio limicola TaxID=167645 RepID=UPI001291449C|nr:chemotaxis protein CheD [Propionivibrio limicola]